MAPFEGSGVYSFYVKLYPIVPAYPRFGIQIDGGGWMDALVIYRLWLFSYRYSYVLKIRCNFVEAGIEMGLLDGSDRRSKQYHFIY